VYLQYYVARYVMVSVIFRMLRRATATPSLSAITNIYNKLHTAHCKLDTGPDSGHCTLYTGHCTLYTAHCTLYTAHQTLHTVPCTLHTAHYTLHTTHCTLHTTHCTINTTHYTLHTTHCTLHTAQWTLHTGHWTLYTVHSLSTITHPRISRNANLFLEKLRRHAMWYKVTLRRVRETISAVEKQFILNNVWVCL